MSALIATANCCVNTQIALDGLCALPNSQDKTFGLLNALTSDANRIGYTQIQDSVANSKCKPTDTTKNVEIKIKKPNCGTSRGCIDLCGEGNATVDPYLYISPCIKMKRGDSFMVSKDDFCQLCENPDDRIATELRNIADNIRQDMCNDIAEKAWALMGNYNDGVLSTATPKHLPVIAPNGSINAPAWAKLKSEFRKMGCKGRPIMVGGETMEMITDLRALGGNNSFQQGAAPNAMDSIMNTYYDSEIDAKLQALAGDTESHVLAWSPGAMQLLEFWNNTGYHEEFKEDYSRTRMLIDGIWYDYTINYDKCNSTYTIGLCKCFDIFCIPDDAYLPCANTNHKLHFTIGCGETACADFNC